MKLCFHFYFIFFCVLIADRLGLRQYVELCGKRACWQLDLLPRPSSLSLVLRNRPEICDADTQSFLTLRRCSVFHTGGAFDDVSIFGWSTFVPRNKTGAAANDGRVCGAINNSQRGLMD